MLLGAKSKIHPGSGSRFQGVKKHRIKDPRSRSATLTHITIIVWDVSSDWANKELYNAQENVFHDLPKKGINKIRMYRETSDSLELVEN
jgi:hypothetical protein